MRLWTPQLIVHCYGSNVFGLLSKCRCKFTYYNSNSDGYKRSTHTSNCSASINATIAILGKCRC